MLGGETQLSDRFLKEKQEFLAESEQDMQRISALPWMDVQLQQQALQDPKKLKELILLKEQSSLELLGQSKTFTNNEIATNFGGAIMDMYSFITKEEYRSSLDSKERSLNFTMNFTEAVHNNWTISQRDINNYADDLYNNIQNFFNKTGI